MHAYERIETPCDISTRRKINRFIGKLGLQRVFTRSYTCMNPEGQNTGPNVPKSGLMTAFSRENTRTRAAIATLCCNKNNKLENCIPRGGAFMPRRTRFWTQKRPLGGSSRHLAAVPPGGARWPDRRGKDRHPIVHLTGDSEKRITYQIDTRLPVSGYGCYVPNRSSSHGRSSGTGGPGGPVASSRPFPRAAGGGGRSSRGSAAGGAWDPCHLPGRHFQERVTE